MMTLVILLMASVMLTGCSATNVYVLDQKELLRVKAGESVTAKFDGWLLSDRAVKRVMEAKVEETLMK